MIHLKFLGLLVLTLLLIGCGTTKVTERTVVRERIDTLIVAGDTVFVEGAGDIEYYGDTVHYTGMDNENEPLRKRETPPFAPLEGGFLASLDTTVERIRLQAKYRYPANVWSVKILQRDSAVKYTVRDSLITNTTVETVPVTPWWVYVVFTGLGGWFLFMAVMKLKSKLGIFG